MALPSRKIVQSIYALQCVAVSVFGLWCGTQLKNLSEIPRKNVEFSSFSWISNLKFGINSVQFKQDEIVAPKITLARVDRIQTAIAAPKRISKKRAIKKVVAQTVEPLKLVEEPKNVMAPELTAEISETEFSQMKNIYSTLRHGFRVAVNNQIKDAPVMPAVTTQTAVAVAEPVMQPVKKSKTARTAQRNSKIAPKAEIAVATQIQVRPEGGSLRQEKVEPKFNVEAKESAVIQPQLFAAHQTVLQKAAAIRAQRDQAIRQQEEFKILANDSLQDTIKDAEPTVIPSPMWTVGDDAQPAPARDYSKGGALIEDLKELVLGTQSKEVLPILTKGSKSPSNSQRIIVAQAAPVAKPTVILEPQTKSDPNPIHGFKEKDTSALNGLVAVNDTHSEAALPPYYEAFTKGKVTGLPREQVLSYEGLKDHSESQWILANLEEHLATITFQSKGDRIATPLISENSALMLAKLSGVTFQKESGIVFGRVPAGWDVQFSGRAEKKVSLSLYNQILPNDDLTQEHWFVFYNVEPGAHLLLFQSIAGTKSGAIGIPVREATVTYIDATRPQERTIKGQIREAANDDGKVSSKYRVEVVGQLKTSVFTKKDGTFEILNALTFGGYPLHLEVETTSGFKHRYVADRKDWAQKDYFVFSEEMIQTWVGQLSGGLSAESGLVVGAFPLLSKKARTDRLYPTTRALSEKSPLVAENYSLSDTGQLLIQQPLDVDRPRYLGVQVPEGANIVEVENTVHDAQWSQLVVASPGVINVVGP